MELYALFEQWRVFKGPNNSWGLSWYLAAEVCRRFYASHGIVPWVICHEGLGYYGISLHKLPCQVNGKDNETLGRFSMGGDVENWLTGGPGDHGCKLIDQCHSGTSSNALVSQAIAHLRLPVVPEKSHVACRHKRWGASYQLCFDIAAIVALRCEQDVSIWNHPEHTKRFIEALDNKHNLKEHPGAFIFQANNVELCLIGDGRLLGHAPVDMWAEYMSGKSAFELANVIIKQLEI